jgi:hypothetical protein
MREGECGGGGAVGMDAGAGVGSVLHEQAGDLGSAVDDGEVDSSMLVTVRDLHVS